ncbi:MAG: DUF3471 domain-containing protein, partial [Acidobacteria bacterium]|nr:DUF3471 domain-containing protein [Acidobacteriota bacterium]
LVARDLLAIYYGQPYTIPAPPTLAKVDPALYDHYAGKYELGPGFVITMTREGNSLMTQATGQGTFELFPESETKFFAKVTELSVTFIKGADGQVMQLELVQGGRTQTAKKVQ